MLWFYSTSKTKSHAELGHLVNEVILSPNFSPPELVGFELPKKQILWTNTLCQVCRELRHLAQLEINGLNHRSSFPFPVMASSMHRRVLHQILRLKPYTIVVLWRSSGLLLLNLLHKNFTFSHFENTGSCHQMNLLRASSLKLSWQTTSWGSTRKSSIQIHRRNTSQL
jgi:hypothetical protein